MTWPDDSPTERGTCGKCGDGYEPYLIFWKEGFVNMMLRTAMRREYGYVCPDCLDEEMEGEGYAIKEGEAHA